MSIFGSIQMAGNTLQAMQIGLHVVGNNIANANTPGFIRERVVYTPAPVMKLGDLTLGLGVEVAGIVQTLDKFAEDRLRGAGSDRAAAEVQEKTYLDLEAILGELSDTDVSTSLTNFFNSIEEIANSPEDVSIRNLAIQSGKTLTTAINNLHRRVETVYTDFGREVENLTTEVNSLTEQISKLNLQIVSLEGGASSASQAGGLRSQRQTAINRLAEIADVDAKETAGGAVNISLHGEILVFEGTRREVDTEYGTSDGLPVATIAFADNGSPLQAASGALYGVYQARDEIAGGFLDRLDTFAGTLAFEFNKIYSQGQGITGYATTTSQNSVNDANAGLDEAGLDFTPTSGTFHLLVRNTRTELTETYRIDVDLDGLDNDTSLGSLAATLDAVDGVSAQVSADGRLRLTRESTELEIGFDGDTSGLLAALGLNTFFTGSTAADVRVNEELAADGSKFAASDDDELYFGVDVQNALRLVGLHDEGVDGLGGSTITGLYDQLLSETAQGSSAAASVAEGYRVFEDTLIATAQAASGVNLDEEAIDMIMLQRTYQASARYIGVLSELLDVLINL
jgi:flagellar hook-associated protein 1 FlgK